MVKRDAASADLFPGEWYRNHLRVVSVLLSLLIQKVDYLQQDFCSLENNSDEHQYHHRPHLLSCDDDR